MRHPSPSPALEGRPSGARLTPEVRWRLALGAIVLLTLVLRLLRLSFQPLWWDEGWSLYFATTDLGSMLRLTAVDIHPPLYYLLLHFWAGMLGAGPVAVRMLSVLIGTATVPLLYLVGRRLIGATGGLLAALLLAVSPFAVYYSQEVRMYGVVTLLGLAAFYFALRIEEEGWRPAPWLGYVVTGTAALYTQYYAAFLLLAINLAMAVRWLRQRRPLRAWLPWLSAQAAVLFLYVPWLCFAGNKLLTYVRYKVGVEKDVPVALWRYLEEHLAAFDWGHAEGGLVGWWWVGLIPLAILVVCLLVAHWLRSRTYPPSDPPASAGGRGEGEGAGDLLSCACLVVGLLLGGFVVNLVFPFSAPRIERQLLLALPYYLVLVAAGILLVWRRRPLLAVLSLLSFLVVALLSLGFFYSVPRYPDDDYRPVASQIAALGRPGDALVAVHPWQIGYFQSYLPDDRRPELLLSPREVLPRERQTWADDPARMASDLDGLLATNGRVWFPAHQAMGRILESQIDTYLVEHAYPVLTEWYGENTVLSLFASGQPAPQPVTARFGDVLALESAAVGSAPVEAGWGTVPVEMTWKLLERTDAPLTVGLRLTDAAGRVWGQRDSEPQGGRGSFTQWTVGEPRPDRLGLLVPAGTPPGDYRLTAQVYGSDDLSVLPVTSEGSTGGEVELGQVHVIRPETPPPAEGLPISQPLVREFGDRLRLLGFDAPQPAPLLPGETVEADLFWQAMRAPGEDYLPRLQLLDSAGTVLTEQVDKPVAGTYPTAWWAAGELVRDPHSLAIPADAAPGRYQLALSLVRAADGRPVQVSGGRTSVDLFDVEVQGREHEYDLPTPQHLQGAQLGQSVELVGYDLADAVQAPGSPLPVTLYWHARGTPDKNYWSFVHLLDANGRIVAQDDGVPGEGRLPALGWLPGEFVPDRHTLLLPPGLPDGEYQLEVGLYDPATEQRLGEQVVLDTALRVSAASPTP
jgi:uncharacterized membrane protein